MIIFYSLLYSSHHHIVTTFLAAGTNLAIIFGARIVVAQLKQSVLPYLKHRFYLHQNMKENEGAGLTRPEKELILHEV